MAANKSKDRSSLWTVGTGQRFGKLITVERFCPYDYNNDTHAYWVCRCDCGKLCRLSQRRLKKGQVVDCSRCHIHIQLEPDQTVIGTDGHDWSWAFVIFRPVVGFDDYLIDSDGNLWSIKWTIAKGKWRLNTPSRNMYGYYQAVMIRDGKIVSRRLHTLVLEAFIGLRPPNMQCRHLDNNQLNNRVSNLCWGTAQENGADRRGRKQRNPRKSKKLSQ